MAEPCTSCGTEEARWRLTVTSSAEPTGRAVCAYSRCVGIATAELINEHNPHLVVEIEPLVPTDVEWLLAELRGVSGRDWVLAGDGRDERGEPAMPPSIARLYCPHGVLVEIPCERCALARVAT